LRRACEQAVAWRQAGVGELRVSVNISGFELAQGDVAERVQAALLDTGATPAMLGIEVTETMLVADANVAARALHALRAIGVQISLDDFGTGYSNLSVLRSLPIDLIKIDRSYVHDVTALPSQVSITRAVITMAHSLHMKVLAEGVETEGQLALLVASGCDAMQGYYYSRPLDAEGVAALWRERPCLSAPYLQNTSRQRTLLVVDDEENIVAALRRSLRRSGYRILTANSATEGLLRLAESEVDVIISDQRMPGMTGVEFLRRAKQLYPDTVRIVLSGYTELESITAAINEGAIYRFLTKPWDDDLLRANIEEAFRQKEMADENRRLDREVRTANQELADLNRRLQQALVAQHERVNLAEGRSGGALEVLLDLPVPLIGIDDDGVIAFASREALNLFPAEPAVLGREAMAGLPAALCAVLNEAEGATANVMIDGQPHHCLLRRLSGTVARGRLLVLLPSMAPDTPEHD
jgi:EAL domain-containing protein (putative c-di-GMP-specific phosphodiesterase class I)/CheY-like chemotaxis protein